MYNTEPTPRKSGVFVHTITVSCRSLILIAIKLLNHAAPTWLPKSRKKQIRRRSFASKIAIKDNNNDKDNKALPAVPQAEAGFYSSQTTKTFLGLIQSTGIKNLKIDFMQIFNQVGGYTIIGTYMHIIKM